MKVYYIRWLNVLLVYITLTVVFVLYGHWSFYRDPGSVFYDESRAFDRHYSAHRQHEVETFVQEISGDHSNTMIGQSGKVPSMCASFLSVAREGVQYMPTSVASCVQGLYPCERRDLYVNVLVAHTNISYHPSSHLTWLPHIVDSMHGYSVSAEVTSKLKQLEMEKNFSYKAVLDYVHALDDCYSTRSPWIIIVEDDVLFAEGWLSSTMQGLHSIPDRFAVSENDWLFMRLFNQERSIGWASRAPGGNNELLISALIILFLVPTLLLLRRRFPIVRKHLDEVTIGIVCLVIIPTSVVLFFQAGKASMLPPQPGVHLEPFGCCSQALVFPRAQVPRVKEYLLARQSGQIDMMLDDLAVEDSLDRFALYPVQLQHIGQVSVRHTTAREAQAIWSIAFENLDPQRLRRSHAKAVETLYGKACAGGK